MMDPQASSTMRADAGETADELSDDALDAVAGGLERAWIGEGVPMVAAREDAPARVEAGL